MDQPEFIRQTNEPLYPKVLYNRPVTRTGGGRLLVVGGHSGEFSLPTTIHQLAVAAGVGECWALLPDTLAKILGGAPGTFFASSNPSGALGTEALGRILELSEESDAIALGASLSGNSNTAVLTEKLVTSLERPFVIFDEGLTSLQHNVEAVTSNPNVLIILTMADIFKLSGKLGIAINIRPDGGLINKLEIIQNLAATTQASYAVYGTEIIIAAHNATDRTTPTKPEPLIVTPINYRLSLTPAIFYAVLTTYWLQNPTDRRAGLATGAYIISQASAHLGSTDRPSVNNLATALDRATRTDDFS